MTINKDEILYNWILSNPDLGTPLLFQFLVMNHGWMAVVPIADVAVVKKYINGSAIKNYDFMLQVAYQSSNDIGSSDNTNQMFSMRKWQDWIDGQQAAGNYPDFGEKCNSYKLENLANMPTMAGRDEDGIAKYQFPARLTYYEAK